MLKYKEIMNWSEEDLTVGLLDTEKEIYKMTCELRINRKMDKPHLLKSLKKDRARILTVMRSKKQ